MGFGEGIVKVYVCEGVFVVVVDIGEMGGLWVVEEIKVVGGCVVFVKVDVFKCVDMD